MPTLNLPARGEIPWDGKINAALETLSDAVDAAIPSTQKGAASGVAPLDSDSRVPDANLPTRLGAAELSAAFVAVRTSDGHTLPPSTIVVITLDRTLAQVTAVPAAELADITFEEV